MKEAVFRSIVGGASVSVLLLLWSLAAPELRVWPLPNPSGVAWRLRRATNRLSGALIGILSAGVLGLAILEYRSMPTRSPWVVLAGATLFLLGGALGVAGYRTLGPAVSHGEPGPLVSNGLYRFSRNPQYVGAVAVLVGASIALGSRQTFIAALACSAWFILAPLTEEAWLRDRLGSAYDAYVKSAPRYFGRPGRRRGMRAPSIMRDDA